MMEAIQSVSNLMTEDGKNVTLVKVNKNRAEATAAYMRI